MSNRNLIILGIVAAVTVTWAVVQSHRVHSESGRPQATRFEDSYLIQGLDLASIASIRIGSDDTPLTLVRQGNGFVVANKHNYPADTGKINDLLVDLADLRVSELVTDDPENHESLHVTEANAETLVKFFDSSDTVLTGVVIGSRHVVEGGSGPAQTYVRLLANPNVYLTEGVPTISDSAVEYVNKELVAIEADEIKSISVSLPEAAYTLTATSTDDETATDGETVYSIDPQPDGTQLKETAARSLFSAFSNISLQDVQQDTAEFTKDLTPAGTLVCTLANEVAYTFDILTGEDTSYLRGKAEFLDTTPVVKENRVETDEELKAKEAKLLARDHAEQFAKTHAGWLYEIAGWKADALLKTPDDLLEDIEPPAVEPTAESSPQVSPEAPSSDSE